MLLAFNLIDSHTLFVCASSVALFFHQIQKSSTGLGCDLIIPWDQRTQHRGTGKGEGAFYIGGFIVVLLFLLFCFHLHGSVLHLHLEREESTRIRATLVTTAIRFCKSVTSAYFSSASLMALAKWVYRLGANIRFISLRRMALSENSKYPRPWSQPHDCDPAVFNALMIANPRPSIILARPSAECRSNLIVSMALREHDWDVRCVILGILKRRACAFQRKRLGIFGTCGFTMIRDILLALDTSNM